MRKKNLFLLAAACSAALVVQSNSVSAQPTNAAPAAPVTAPGAPGGPRPVPNRLFAVRNSILTLDRAIMELQRSDNDFGGHRQSAIDACTKAKEELTEIAKQAGIALPPPRGNMPGMMMRPAPPADAPQQAAPPPAAAPGSPQ